MAERGPVAPGGAPQLLPAVLSALGNRVVQRMLRRSHVARDESNTAPPGLPESRAQDAQELLTSDPQGAVDEVVAGMAARGAMEPSSLEGERVEYDAETRLPSGHFGHSSLTPGSGLPRPIRVVVGADALRSLNVLYATIQHEYRHVLELRAGLTSEAAGEVDAYLEEIEGLESSGAWRDMRYMTHLRSALRHWWDQLDEHEQLERQETYTAALEAWQAATERRLEEQFRAQTGG